ncbi:hypothetical protein DFH06DRAFT_1475565 [Mycena polygramma]|nr:hypothetical protein DFH06DRAFT_1475565 [Mycena polygramma]
MLAGLEADRVRVAELQAQIVQLELSVSALRNEKSLVQERLDAYKYPVSTLPNEIISEIFVHFLPAYPRIPPLTGTFSPALLTQICRRWREIALATPALWRAVGSYNEGIALNCEMLAEIFNIWLNRSRCCPVSIEIGKADPNVDLSKILATVVPHRARCECLELALSPAQLRVIEGPMPWLRNLDLLLSANLASDGDVQVVLREVPLLRIVALNDVAASMVVLPWAQITSLTLAPVFPYECVPILQQTTNLVYCELHVFDSSSEPPWPDITLPYLKTLVFVDPHIEQYTNFHESFIVPALRNLEVPEPFLGSNPIDSIKGFISKSGCKLENLHITGAKSRPDTSIRREFLDIQNIGYNGCWI